MDNLFAKGLSYFIAFIVFIICLSILSTTGIGKFPAQGISLVVAFGALSIAKNWFSPKKIDPISPEDKLNAEDKILNLYNEFSDTRKDLSEDGIIIKIEDEYKYKEDLIREVIKKFKNTKISCKVVEEENQQFGPEKNTLLNQSPIEISNKISPAISPHNFIGPLNKIVKTSAELLQTNSARQFDVNMGLSDIKRNCEEALLALQKGIDIEGTPITSTEVGKGLRLLWTNFGIGWIDIVKSKMKASEHMALKRILNEIERISQELENSKTA
jgi:hypothetical protein